MTRSSRSSGPSKRKRSSPRSHGSWRLLSGLGEFFRHGSTTASLVELDFVSEPAILLRSADLVLCYSVLSVYSVVHALQDDHGATKAPISCFFSWGVRVIRGLLYKT